MHEPPGDLMALEREGPYSDRNIKRPRVGVRRLDAQMRRIADAIVEGITRAMGTLELTREVLDLVAARVTEGYWDRSWRSNFKSNSTSCGFVFSD